MATAATDQLADGPLDVLVVGAHPDDCEVKAGGTAAEYAARGHDVTFVSLTDGRAGHHEASPQDLVARRRAESAAAADALGVEFESLSIPGAELRPTIENRNRVIRLLREREPDLVFTHRPNDYHPDHRYGADLVQDAAYLVTVPAVCPGTDHLTYNPVICYLSDEFRKPAPLRPDVVVDIDDAVEAKLDALHEHESQVYEWLPYNDGVLDEVPDGEAARREWLAEQRKPAFAAVADRFRDRLRERYGPERGEAVQHAEAFEACEYGGDLTEENRDVLFPF